MRLIHFRVRGQGTCRSRSTPGAAVPHEEFLEQRRALIGQDLQYPYSLGAVWQAETLVYVDLPLPTHFWRVTNRLIKGLFAVPHALLARADEVIE